MFGLFTQHRRLLVLLNSADDTPDHLIAPEGLGSAEVSMAETAVSILTTEFCQADTLRPRQLQVRRVRRVRSLKAAVTKGLYATWQNRHVVAPTRHVRLVKRNCDFCRKQNELPPWHAFLSKCGTAFQMASLGDIIISRAGSL
ncbi:hypothetical protein RFM68_31760 [Mesorhizobium sp. MSK_1335]|uniref:Uncharacterized protein n=1 Tax=Mesorhizobium montanum TaxID=3072323 RepID=A0ABU4ZUE9_9HYPH|nr:hypothetical protein [Mesorhizobium sp. MSK_1335]MDX8529043.1 hypothetical protein [Mesorhizobium sp. MSK_1335]